MRRLTKSLSILILSTVALVPSAWGKDDQIRDAMQAGGDQLVALQNADGGWFFFVGDPDCGLGSGVSCPNTFGVTALGLVDSFRVVHDGDHRAAAMQAGDALVAKHAAAPPCDGNPGTSADRPFTVDVTFLLDGLGRTAGNEKKVYRDVARSWFACVIADFPDGATRADNRINGRIGQGLTNLGAWDASLDVRAAVAVRERAYALAEAKQIVAREPDWDVADLDCPGCDLLSKGLFLAATETLRNDQSIRDARARWRDDLLAAQSLDGSWGGDTQVTAYVVMGLAAMSQGHTTRDAINRAVEFLLSMQLLNGGFAAASASSDEYTEVDGEVLQALRATRSHDE